MISHTYSVRLPGWQGYNDWKLGGGNPRLDQEQSGKRIMCGICGELRLDDERPDLAAIGRMTRKLESRGPDHEGSYSDGPLGFGHRRLAIIDLSERANQPMIDQELGLALVFNGTIYNYPELRATLKQKLPLLFGR